MKGKEKINEFRSEVLHRSFVEYEFRSIKGQLFRCIEDSLSDCHKKRKIWQEKLKREVLSGS